MRAEKDPQKQRHLHALQNTFKILINSFYGYLGFAQGHFAVAGRGCVAFWRAISLRPNPALFRANPTCSACRSFDARRDETLDSGETRLAPVPAANGC